MEFSEMKDNGKRESEYDTISSLLKGLLYLLKVGGQFILVGFLLNLKA
jgi:hypothetical protein